MKILAMMLTLFAIGCGQPGETSDDSAELKSASCKTARACKGALPDLCKLCSDGSDGCAHWACDNNKCEIDYCAAAPAPSPAPPAPSPSAPPAPSPAPPAPSPAPPAPSPAPPAPSPAPPAPSPAPPAPSPAPPAPSPAPPAPSPAPPACEPASDCHGILPEICERCSINDRTECAHFVCVQGQCQEQLCPQCESARDCTGPLPELCLFCSNGTAECPHHDCESGVCVIATTTCR